jgi:hypothetical protein
MSCITDVVIWASSDQVGDINSWLLRADERRQQIQKINLERGGAGGTKLMSEYLHAAGLNYAPEGLADRICEEIEYGIAITETESGYTTIVVDGKVVFKGFR